MQPDKFYSLIQDDLKKVEETLMSASHVDFGWLSEMIGEVVRSGGKRLRPVVTLLAGKFYNYRIEQLCNMAAAVEMLHTATLVHDDAIDRASVRRGHTTINELWGDDTAILLGDYLFARSADFAASCNNVQVVRLFAQTLMIISRGELNQAIYSYKLPQTREQYFNRIANKTASLFSFATESGAILSEAPESAINYLREYGYNLGIAFQIIDDILDFTSTETEMGKPIGSDLAQGIITLPSLLFLERYPDNNPIIDIFTNAGKEHNEQRIAKVTETILNSSIIDECYEIAGEYSARAKEQLVQLPESPAGDALRDIADYSVRRSR